MGMLCPWKKVPCWTNSTLCKTMLDEIKKFFHEHSPCPGISGFTDVLSSKFDVKLPFKLEDHVMATASDYFSISLNKLLNS